MVTGLDYYMDGGTAQITTDDGNYYFDRRLTYGTNDLYDKYPDKDGAKVVSDAIKNQVAQMLDDLMNDPERGETMPFFSESGARFLIRDIRESLGEVEVVEVVEETHLTHLENMLENMEEENEGSVRTGRPIIVNRINRIQR